MTVTGSEILPRIQDILSLYAESDITFGFIHIFKALLNTVASDRGNKKYHPLCY